MQFDSPPSTWSAYARVLAVRKPPRLPDGADLPRIEATLSRVRVDDAQLGRYREICGLAPDDSALPIAFPHILASPLHLALLSSTAFPVRLFGLVHVRNRIEQRQPLPVSGGGTLLTWLEGYRDTPRGQEFDLQTEWIFDGSWHWRETCTFLARAPTRRDGAAAPASPAAAAEPSGPVRTTSVRADAGLGRSYGLISGDMNPIHLSDLTARAFGFRGAIAHGMWSLARCAAELPAHEFARPLGYDVEFRAPVFLPAWLQMQQWAADGASAFELRDAQGDRVHLRGTLRSLD